MTTQKDDYDVGREHHPERPPMQEAGQLQPDVAVPSPQVGTPTGAIADSSPPSDPHFGVDDGDYKICKICGDKALGYNFNVISCESCKAFFRRNANKSKEFRCPSNNSCTITVASRRFCQRCRLKKCFDEGMKKEWIMSDDALLERRQRNEGKKFELIRIPSANDGGLIHRSLSYDPFPMQGPPNKRLYFGPSASDDASLYFRPNTFVPNFAPRHPTLPSTRPLWNSQLASATPRYPSTSAMASSHGPSALDPYIPMAATSSGSFGLPVPIASSSVAQSISASAHYSPTLLPTQPYMRPIVGQYQEHESRSQPGHLHSVLKPSVTALPMEQPPQRYHGDAQLTLPCQEASQLQNEDDNIYVPKTVLANLVSQCYSMLQQQQQQSAASMGVASSEAAAQIRDQTSSFLPVLEQVKELTSQENIDQRRHAPLNCICHCVCGAKPVGSKIGVDKSDKCFGTDHKPDSYPSTSEPSSSASQEQVQVCGKAGSKNSAVWLSLDEQDSSVWKDSPLNANQPSSAAPGMSLFMWLRMEELIAANQVMNEPTDFSLLTKSPGTSTNDGADANPLDVTMMINICIRRIIRMCKRVGAFKTLCQEDQIALLKGSCTELLVLRGVMAYNAERDAYDVSWYPTSQGQVTLDILKRVKGNCYNEHKRYLQSFEDTWRRDERIMLMLGALTLFYPQRRNIVHEQVIDREHEFYLKLLKNYLDITFDQDEAQRTYLALCDRLNTLRQRVHEYAATIFLDVDPRDLEPLLLEVLDLKDYAVQTD